MEVEQKRIQCTLILSKGKLAWNGAESIAEQLRIYRKQQKTIEKYMQARLIIQRK